MTQDQGLKKILIIDDDKVLLDMYSIQFQEKGFEVVQAVGSTDALHKLKNGITPDALLLDLVMPTIDGFELLGLIKNENLATDAKIIILSNLGQPSDVERARTLGAHEYIVKASVTPSELAEKVSVVLKGGESFASTE